MRIFPASREKFAFVPEIEPIHRENNVQSKTYEFISSSSGDGWQGKFFPCKRPSGERAGKIPPPPAAGSGGRDRPCSSAGVPPPPWHNSYASIWDAMMAGSLS